MAGLQFDRTITLSSTVADVGASVAWFKDKLGFEVVFQVEGWAEVTTPVGDVTIGLAESEERYGRGGTTPVFGVQDIAAARADLEGRGVRFEGDTIELPGLVKLATFLDPDGNAYMLAQSLMAGR